MVCSCPGGCKLRKHTKNVQKLGFIKVDSEGREMYGSSAP